MRALDPRSPDDPCRYVTVAADAKILEYATKAGSCKAVLRVNEREQQGGAIPQRLGAAEILLGQPVRVPSESSGRLADGAELRFAGISNHLITVVRERGQWRIAAPAGTI